MSNAKLRSCPFCSCEEKITAEIPTKRGRRYQIICSHCGAKTGRKKTEEEAIAAWERRCHIEQDEKNGEMDNG